MARSLTQLVITPSYPPVDSSVTLITIKVIEALERLGIKTVVISVCPEDVDYSITPSLEKIFRSDRKVYRIKAYEKGGRLLTATRNALKKTPINYLPDNHYIWTVNAIRALPNILRSEKIDIIHSISAPYASHIVGYRAKMATGKPWICNLMDFWAAQPAEHFDRYRNLNYWMQDRCVEKADGIIASTNEILEITSRRYQQGNKSKFICIPPSFDPSHYPKKYRMHEDKYLFVFLGVMYRKRREPTSLFTALKELRKEEPSVYRKLEFRLVGVEPAEWEGQVDDGKLGDVVKLKPRVDYSESMRLMKEAGILIHIGFMSGKYPQDIHVSGKLYEYVGAQRLILGLTTPEGPVADFIRNAGGLVADYRDPKDIKNAIIGIVKNNRPRKLYSWKAPGAVEAYDANSIAISYRDTFISVMETRGKNWSS